MQVEILEILVFILLVGNMKIINNTKEFFLDIYYKYLSDIKYYPKYLKEGLTNLFQYFVIIWLDRNWDYAYTEQLLIFKLKRQAKYIEKNKRFLSWEREVQKINTVVKLLERDLDEFYGMEYQDYYIQKVVWKDTEHCKNCKELEFELIEDNSATYFLKHVSAWKKLCKDPEIDSTVRMCLYLGRERQQKCHDLAYELIKRNIQRWWD